jgi:hypothetical protein
MKGTVTRLIKEKGKKEVMKKEIVNVVNIS